jgi:hypothetical protein
MSAAVIYFDAALFRAQFPAFADANKYSNELLQGNWDAATCIVTNVAYGCDILGAKCRQRVLNLLTAHITALNDIANSGGTAGIVTSASIDKVSVTNLPPPVKSSFSYWLNLTPYGQQLLALLTVSSVGGMYVGGLPEGSAIRKVGGIF